MTEPEMHMIDSSNVEAVGFDEDEQEIWVRFLSGDTYVYSDANEAIFNELLHASSVGSYLNRAIKGNFAYRKV